MKVCFALLAAIAAPLTACGDDGAEPGPDAAPAGPAYVGATRVFTGESDSVGFLFVTDSLAPTTQIDLANAVEIDDAWVFGNADPYFYTATIFAPEITQWSLGADNTLIQGPTISFANAGVTGTYIAASTPLFSATKSYFVDAGSQQVVVWNPEAMTFTKTIPIPAPAVTGMTATFDIAVRDDRVFVTAFWASQASGWTEFGERVQITAIDTATDTIVETTTDTRCRTISPAGGTSDGTLYFSPWDYHAAVRSVFGAGFGTESCALRVVPSGASFDAGYEVDLSSLVGGKAAGGLRLIDDTTALIHVWDGSVAATPETWVDDRFAPGYRWYRWTLGAPTATVLPDQAPSTEGGEWRELDGMTVSYNPNPEYTETTLVSLESDGRFATHLTIPGWITAMIRAR